MLSAFPLRPGEAIGAGCMTELVAPVPGTASEFGTAPERLWWHSTVVGQGAGCVATGSMGAVNCAVFANLLSASFNTATSTALADSMSSPAKVAAANFLRRPGEALALHVRATAGRCHLNAPEALGPRF
ncbi:MAG: hypothetical protein ACI8TX_003843 [Hyphomicrobiaceae bacterium]|jgi:hypothetical protein